MAYDKNIYARIVSNEVSEEEIAQLKFSGEWEEIQQILQMTASFYLPVVNEDKGFEELLRKKEELQIKSRRLVVIRLLSMAAVLLFILGFVIVYFTSASQFEALPGENQLVDLEDGSSILLNDGSSISFKEGNFEERRLIHLKGEAFFDVEPGAPFIVESALGKVTVLGTAFNVNAWKDVLLVECYEGRVEVEQAGGKQVISKGEAIALSQSGDLMVERILYQEPHWTKGVSVFKNRPLSQVLYELGRQYDVEVEMSISEKVFSGQFTHSKLEEALDEICRPLGLQYEILDPKKVRVY